MKRFISFLLLFSVTLSFCAANFACSQKRPIKDTTKETSKNSISDEVLPPPEPLVEEDPSLEITELMIKNSVGITAPDDQPHPWIELFAKERVSLSEYSLVYADSAVYDLPDLTLEAGEYYVVYMYKDGFDIVPDSSAKLTLMHGEYLCQSFVYINRSENCSYIVKDGSETKTPTPGYENVLEADRLLISELMCDNDLYPINGSLCDWIEIYNGGESDILLSEYWMSDKPDSPYLSHLPEITLKPGEYYVLSCDRELDFGLSKNGETVVLTRRDGVVSSSLSYENFEKNCSYTIEKGVSKTPSPGYPNSEEGAYMYAGDRRGLVINEVISSNSKYKKYGDDYYDIVELYNNSDADISLGEYCLSDKSKKLDRFILPKHTLKAGEYMLIYCTGKGGSDPDFKISSDGEKLYLSRNDGYVCDTMLVPELPHNVSYGRGENSYLYFDTPTLGAANKTGCKGISGMPAASMNSGIYEGKIGVTLKGEGNIYYTTDGSTPTLRSKKYEGETIVFDRTGSLRAFCSEEGLIAGKEMSFFYIVNEPSYSLPIVTISVNDEDMFGKSGVYQSSSKKKELPARFSFFENGEEKLSVGCGIKLFGNASLTLDKKSFQLKFRGEYGTSRLEYKMFDDIDIDSFNALVLRSGSHAMWRTLVNDEFVTTLCRRSGNTPTLLTQSYKACELYVNHRYMGMYFIREKIDDDFVASHCGTSPEDATIIYRTRTIEWGTGGDEWVDLWYYVVNHDLRKKECYEHVKSILDIESIADYYIVEMWCGNRDSTNCRVYKSGGGDGKWRYILYDVDRAFSYDESSVSHYLSKYTSGTKPPNNIIYKLLQNEEFYAFFKERLELHISSTFSEENVRAVFESIISEIRPDIPYEIERWAFSESTNSTVSEWENECGILLSRSNTKYTEKFVAALESACDKIKKTVL